MSSIIIMMQRLARFQSLLSWIGFLSDHRHRLRPATRPVSILVVVDRSPQPPDFQGAIGVSDEFQSLLSWIVLLSVLILPRKQYSADEFQSLLSWIVLLSSTPIGMYWPLKNLFQSLLSWIVLLSNCFRIG